MDSYMLLTSPGEGYYEEKRSRFLGSAVAVSNEEEALKFLAARRKEHPDARHHCYAFVCGPRHELTRFSDDGEPSGTGGRPILDVLLGSGLHNALIVVTRYFGGTLLGTGGLARAYSAAASEAVSHAGSGALFQGALWRIGLSYGEYGKIDRLLSQEDIPRVSESFTDRVSLEILLLKEQEEAIPAQLADLTAGLAQTERVKMVSFLREGKNILLMDQDKMQQ